MTDRPILFSGPMVRALLEGRKTQTRRVINPQPSGDHALFFSVLHEGKAIFRNEAQGLRQDVPCRFETGDRLYVRESIVLRQGERAGRIITDQPQFLADGAPVMDGAGYASNHWFAPTKRKATPSIHMPRWASRLTLLVTDVRVQRLQDISEEDAKAEGVEQDPSTIGFWGVEGQGAVPGTTSQWATAKLAFRDLWDSINAKRGFGWEENPWVVAVTFSVHRCNIDQLASFQEEK